MKVTIHRGSRQIGGTCIEVATAGTRLILDAGLPLEASLDSRGDRGCAPDISVPGLFGPGTSVDAILLSHAHPDHSGLLSSRRRGIPVYMTKATSKILTSLYMFARGAWIGDQTILEDHVSTPIGDCAVTALPVDHSIAGACAFLVEAEGKRVLYSGDLRLHGRKPGMAARLAAAARRGKLDLLIIEGTRLPMNDGEQPSSRYLPTEEAVEGRLVEIIRDADGLVLACFGPTNIDRHVSFLRAAIKTRREFALDAYSSHVLHMLGGRGRGGLPDPLTCEHIRLLPGTGKTPARAEGKTEDFLQRMRQKTVGAQELRDNPRGFIAIARPSSLGRDFPLGLPPDTLAVYSMWSGYRDRAEWRAFTATVEAAGGRVEECHGSGHIHPKDLRDLIRDIDPVRLVPVHTGAPEAFKQLWTNVLVATDGVPFEV